MSKTVISVGRICFQLDQDKHTVRQAQLAEALASRDPQGNRINIKAAVGDTPLQAGETLQAELVRYLTSCLGTNADLAAFTFTTYRSEVDESGLFWSGGAEYLTRLPVVGSLETYL